MPIRRQRQRQANDGQWYTFEEFNAHYGRTGKRQWDAAQKEAKLEHSNVKPLAEKAPRSQQGTQVVPVSESSVVQPHAEVVGIASSLAADRPDRTSTNLPPAGDDGPPLAADAGREHSKVTPLAEESQRSWDTYGDDSQRGIYGASCAKFANN